MRYYKKTRRSFTQVEVLATYDRPPCMKVKLAGEIWLVKPTDLSTGAEYDAALAAREARRKTKRQERMIARRQRQYAPIVMAFELGAQTVDTIAEKLGITKRSAAQRIRWAAKFNFITVKLNA